MLIALLRDGGSQLALQHIGIFAYPMTLRDPETGRT